MAEFFVDLSLSAAAATLHSLLLVVFGDFSNVRALGDERGGGAWARSKELSERLSLAHSILSQVYLINPAKVDR